MKMINSYFDTSDFAEPVKKELTEYFYYALNPDITLNNILTLSENTLELKDDYFQYGNPATDSFYRVSQPVQNFYKRLSARYLLTEVKLSSEVTQHGRTVSTWFDMLGQVGGVYGIVSAICGLIIGYYSEQMLYYQVLSK